MAKLPRQSFTAREGWLYLDGVKDVHICEIVVYAMGARMTQELTGHALIREVVQRRPAPGLIHRSNRANSTAPAATKRR